MIIEKLVIDYLETCNLGVNVYAETPVDPEDYYILVRRSGGSQADYIRDYTIHTEVFGKNKLRAAEIHEAVIAAMLEMRDHTEVFRCNLNSDYDATLPSMKAYRYQALWQITT